MSTGEWITVALAALAFVAWVFRTLVLDRITSLDTRIDRVREELLRADKEQEQRFDISSKDQGRRLGRIDGWIEAHDKAERAARRAVADERSRANAIPESTGDDEDSSA